MQWNHLFRHASSISSVRKFLVFFYRKSLEERHLPLHPWEHMCSTVEDINQYWGGYHHYIEGCSVLWEIFNTVGGTVSKVGKAISSLGSLGDIISTARDTISTVGDTTPLVLLEIHHKHITSIPQQYRWYPLTSISVVQNYDSYISRSYVFLQCLK